MTKKEYLQQFEGKPLLQWYENSKGERISEPQLIELRVRSVDYIYYRSNGTLVQGTKFKDVYKCPDGFYIKTIIGNGRSVYSANASEVAAFKMAEEK